ncbi:hypothetical protein EV356DRAFT_519874 [Viridothelium virens]|uniref:Uncharacterized protein n=1 Tax=Viridothelium virens TaxID=1048519 RepID=A0A6A6GXC8_VIRVR|nr:hypothetical protein EV356DRAFT_519874 [Viridothelium virens]
MSLKGESRRAPPEIVSRGHRWHGAWNSLPAIGASVSTLFYGLHDQHSHSFGPLISNITAGQYPSLLGTRHPVGWTWRFRNVVRMLAWHEKSQPVLPISQSYDFSRKLNIHLSASFASPVPTVMTKMANSKAISIPKVVVSPTSSPSDMDTPHTPRSSSTSSESSERGENTQRRPSIQWAEPVAVKPKKKSKPSIKRTLTLLA